LQNLSDRALKERIIGAVLLVVLAILVVPVFLDGPSGEEEVISQSVTLPGQDQQEREQQTIVLERDREQPVPAARTQAPTQASPVVRKEVVEEPAEEEPRETVVASPKEAPVETPAQTEPPPDQPAVAADTSTTGMWAVQLGSFSNQENAERLAAELREQGYLAFISKLQDNGSQQHRVRIGPQKDRASAEAIAAQLAKSGHNGQVRPHP
jgi:DedD protein